MSEQEWLTGEIHRRLRRHLVIWSDGPGYQQACELADSYRHLLPRPVTASQLHGLRNIVGAASSPNEVAQFTKRQGQKAERRGDLELRDYWQTMGKALARLNDTAKELWAAIGGEELNLPKRQAGDALETIHLQLMRGFVQHLVAHSMYLSVEHV